MKNTVGEIYSRLTIIEDLGSVKGRKRVICKCECGNLKNVLYQHIKSGATKSCGCLQKEIVKNRETKHGGKGTSLYNRWKAMRQRCNNPNNKGFKNYGGRGIKICKSWNKFINFREWALLNGYEEGFDLDRKDNSKGYNEENCRFVPKVINNRNRRITVRVEGLTLREIANKYSKEYSKIHYKYYRIKRNKKPTIKDLIC